MLPCHQTSLLELTLKVNPESGVPLSCLPAYFEAYDAYAQRVDNEVTMIIMIK